MRGKFSIYLQSDKRGSDNSSGSEKNEDRNKFVTYDGVEAKLSSFIQKEKTTTYTVRIKKEHSTLIASN